MTSIKTMNLPGPPAIMLWSILFMVSTVFDSNVRAQNRTLSTNAVEYTINNNLPTDGVNFSSFNAAFSALTSVSSPVVFNVAPNSGPYNEQLNITHIKGASATNTLTINGNGATVTLSVPPASGQQTVVLLDKADHIIIDNLKVNSTIGFGILLTNSDSNTIRNCNVVMPLTASNNHTGIFAVSSPANLITNNTITGGGTGIGINAGIDQLGNNEVSNNSVRDFLSTGISIIGAIKLLVEDNDISRPFRSNATGFKGIYISGSANNLVVTKNKIHNPNDGDLQSTASIAPITLSGTSSLLVRQPIISNNLIYNVNGNGDLKAITHFNSGYAKYIHNTISLDDISSTTTSRTIGFYVDNSNNATFQNNIVSMARGGSGEKGAVNIYNSTYNMDYNDYYVSPLSGKNYISNVYNGSGTVMYTSLAQWQSSGQDIHSFNFNPLYSNDNSNYQPTEAILDNKGIYVDVNTDILNRTRSTVTPDIGALEFDVPVCVTPPTGGRAVSSTSAICSETVELTLTGYSSGMGQVYQWESADDPNGAYTPLGNPQAVPDTTISPVTTKYYRVAVVCSGLTSYSSPVLVTVPPFFPAGTYSINSNLASGNGNFNSFNNALLAIKCGIAGPIVFDVAPGSGPYNEQIIIQEIAGTSDINTVTVNGNGATIFKRLDTSEGVISLNGADHFILDNLVIHTDNGYYGSGINLVNNANYNTILNCTISLSTSTTEYSATGILATGGSYNTIVRNHVSGGNFAVYVGSTGSRIINNVVQDFLTCGIYLSGTSKLLAYGNDISRPSRTSPGIFYGIYLDKMAADDTLSNNLIHNPFGANPSSTARAYGIYFANPNTPAGTSVWVTNNLIYNINGNGTAVGISLNGARNTRIYHNTISIDNPNPSAFTDANGLFYYNSSGVEFKNNLLSISKAGTGLKQVVSSGDDTSSVALDYNNYYINTSFANSYVGARTNNNNYANLASWQAATGQDMHSVSIKPFFKDSANANFRPRAAILDNKGVNAGITSDLAFQPRNATTPDIGAYEFSVGDCTSPPTAGSAVAITPPAICPVAYKNTPPYSPIYDAQITLSLTGNSTGAGQTYQWERAFTEGGPFTAYGSVHSNPDTTFTFQSSDDHNYYRAAVTCGGNTTYSTAVRLLGKQLAGGTYSINPYEPAGPSNFQTFTAATNALKCGVTGPVTFNVSPGSYNEQLVLSSISGASQTNRITFQGVSNNRGAVNISFNTTNSYTIFTLNSASYITFRSLTIAPYSPGLPPYYNQAGVGFSISNVISDSIIDCRIVLPGSRDGQNYALTGIRASGMQNSAIINTSISGGNYGISLQGGSNVTLNGNTVNGINAAIEVSDVAQLKVNNNLASSGGGDAAYGIKITDCNNALEVMNNRASVSTNGSTQEIGLAALSISSTNSASQPGRILNNYVGMGGGTNNPSYFSPSCFSLSGSNLVVANNVIEVSTSVPMYRGFSCGGTNLVISNNTISTRREAGIASANNITAVSLSGSNLIVRNNIFSHKDNGTAIYIADPLTVQSNYNDLYTTSNIFVRTGTPSATYADLQSWRNASGRDMNSLSYPPAFISTGNLKPDSSNAGSWALNGQGIQIVGNDKDIYGNPRPTTFAEGVPDLGAYEFTPVVAPPVATAIPAIPVAGTTQSFLFATDTVAKINWAAGAPVPASIEVKRYSGVMPPFLPAGSSHMFFYDSIKATGPGAYNYSVDIFYKDPWLGTITGESVLKLAKGGGGTWLTYNNSSVNTQVNTLYASGLNDFALFTGLEAGRDVTFSGKVFLQGAYDLTSGLMSNTLNSLGILQANASVQPYIASAFGYAGTENVGANFFNAHPDIVDWVLIELRDDLLPSNVRARRAAFVTQDGTLVDINGGNTQITFPGIAASNYHVAIRHRNHLAIRSAGAVDFSSGAGTFDFTTSASRSFQNQSYTSTVPLGSIWAMRGGNANSDNSTKFNGPGNDQNQVLNSRLGGSLSTVMINQYVAEDLNMDGTVKANGPDNEPNILLNIILGGFLSTIFNEQL